MCDVTYRRHGLKIERGIRGEFAETVGVQADCKEENRREMEARRLAAV